MVAKEIAVKFHPDMIRAMFDCGKDRTSRFKKLGEVGDWFILTHPDTLEKREWQIAAIGKNRLGEVAMHMHKKEGFISEDDFWKFWNRIHPERNTPDLMVFVHMLEPKKSMQKTL